MAKKWTKAENEYLEQNYPKKREPELARALGRTELSIYNQLQRLRLVKSKPQGIKSKYRYDITDTTCMQLCIGDFEGIPAKELCDLYGVNPRCLPRMLEDLKRSGLYRQYINEFKVCNPPGYDRAIKKQRRKRRVG